MSGSHAELIKISLPCCKECLTVSPGIEPGYVVFPSHKNNVQFIVGRTATVWKKYEISSSAPGLSVMTHRKCRVDHPFPVTWLGNG
jgi:hypothetical protein